jgi:hypothetical protein
MSDAKVNMIIPFDEIAPGATVRFTVKDGTQYLSIRDIIIHMCKKNNDRAGAIWRNLRPEQKEELREFIMKYQFQGQGQSEQPVITSRGAMKLLMWLPGSHAKSMRSAAADIIARYVEGDKSLCLEIAHNKQIGQNQACAVLMNSAIKKRKHDDENSSSSSMPTAGWVYGTASDAFLEMIKIGRTQDLKERLASGNTFCAPAKHVVVAAVPSFDPIRDEKAAHAHFEEHRCGGEFFKVTKEAVQLYFNLHLMPLYQRELAATIAKLHPDNNF